MFKQHFRFDFANRTPSGARSLAQCATGLMLCDVPDTAPHEQHRADGGEQRQGQREEHRAVLRRRLGCGLGGLRRRTAAVVHCLQALRGKGSQANSDKLHQLCSTH